MVLIDVEIENVVSRGNNTICRVIDIHVFLHVYYLSFNHNMRLPYDYETDEKHGNHKL